FILTNPYLLAALLMVVGCAICGNLAQTTYEKYLEISGLKGKRTPCEYILFKVKENLLTNICCILTSLFVSGNIIRRFGWKALAYMAPIIMLVIGTLFLGASMLYQSNQTKWVYESIGLDGKSIMCSLGMLQSIASIFAKYAFFDISKALVYTGMDVEVRTKGRGMINVIGSRLGKLLSSLIQIGALSLLSPEESIFDITWLLWLVFCCFGLLWILSIRYIGGILKKQNKID
ncbi:MAG: Npt1/Npt2 family nucleotide transporter, partial [Cytophagales bacterium]